MFISDNWNIRINQQNFNNYLFFSSMALMFLYSIDMSLYSIHLIWKIYNIWKSSIQHTMEICQYLFTLVWWLLYPWMGNKHFIMVASLCCIRHFKQFYSHSPRGKAVNTSPAYVDGMRSWTFQFSFYR